MAKIAVIGAGHVGSHVALECARQGLAGEIALLDIHAEKARGHAADIQDATAYSYHEAHVYESDYAGIADADIAVMAACDAGYESADRLLELPAALRVADAVIDGLMGCGFRGTIVSITNPCDLIALHIARRTGLCVIGTGTMLDSARFCVRIARALGVPVEAVEAYCLGEHGDSQVPALSTVRISGAPLPAADWGAVQKATVTAGWDIVLQKGCTEFAIGAAAARLIRAILYDEGAVLPCSTYLDGPYGAQGVYASVPCRVGKGGARPLPGIALTDGERAALINSFLVLKERVPGEPPAV